jgi:hypothetical protein
MPKEMPLPLRNYFNDRMNDKHIIVRASSGETESGFGVVPEPSKSTKDRFNFAQLR